MHPSGHHARLRLVPLWVRLAFTLFVAVLVPVYLAEYGPTNFLYFCDAALLLTLISIWSGRMIWASAAAVGILLPQAVWMVDFMMHALGWHVTDMTAYMFDDASPRLTRFLSLFHFWLPLFLLYLLKRQGYDPRSIWLWWALASILLVLCYFFVPMPPAPGGKPSLPVNVNYVFGLSNAGPQTWMPPLLYFCLELVILPLLVFWPTHLLLRRLFSRAEH